MQLMNQLLYVAPSQFHLHVLHKGKAPRQCHALEDMLLFIYLFGMGAVYLECTATWLLSFSVFMLG